MARVVWTITVIMSLMEAVRPRSVECQTVVMLLIIQPESKVYRIAYGTAVHC